MHDVFGAAQKDKCRQTVNRKSKEKKKKKNESVYWSGNLANQLEAHTSQANDI